MQRWTSRAPGNSRKPVGPSVFSDGQSRRAADPSMRMPATASAGVVHLQEVDEGQLPQGRRIFRFRGSGRRGRTRQGRRGAGGERRQENRLSLRKRPGGVGRKQLDGAGGRRRVEWSGKRVFDQLGLNRRCNEVGCDRGGGKAFGRPEVRSPADHIGRIPRTENRQQKPNPWPEDDAGVARAARGAVHLFYHCN